MTTEFKILLVDLTSSECKQQQVPAEIYRKFPGGMALANYIAAEYAAKTDIEPFSPQNPIIITPGSLAGTPAPSTSRTSAVTLMPLNSTWGSASGGGNFAARLKWTGFDALVITGRSPYPVYLVIGEDVSVRPAEDLWGKGILRTTETLWQRHQASSVVAMGPAGEKKVSFALAMIDNVATLGRGGLGAVMGDKNLKAVVAWGGNVMPRLAQRGKFLSLAREINKDLREIPWREQWLQKGIYLGWPVWKQGLTMKNFRSRLSDEHAERLGPKAYAKHFRRPLACISCPMADKAVVECNDQLYPVSYGLHAALSGSRWGAENEADALSAMIEANDQGVDDLTLSAVTGWAVDLYQHGVINQEDTGGMILEHTADCYRQMAAEIVERRGLGDLLAEGFLANIDRWGETAAELAVHIKGVDPISDPRPHSSGFLFAQLTNPRGAYVVQGNSPAFNPGKSNKSFRRFLSGIGVAEKKAAAVAPEGGELDLALLVRHTEDWYAVASSLGFCARQPVIQSYSPQRAAELLKAATGMDFTPQEVLLIGERAWNQYRLNNAQLTAENDCLPDALYQPLKTDEGQNLQLQNYEHTSKLNQQQVADSIQRYYQDRGWRSNGQPTEKTAKLLELRQG